MRQKINVIGYFTMLLLLAAVFFPAYAAGQGAKVFVLEIRGAIGPAAAEFLKSGINKAADARAEALVIELDTPGGLDTSMRSMVRDILGSGVPVVVFVSPAGARAASAGVFITMAAHIAAMSPGTNIGAAHPVAVGGTMDKTMSEKAGNDAAAYLQSIAEQRGRNAVWAEEAVRKSVSITETEALNKKVVDLLSSDLRTLLADIDGKTVKTVSGERRLSTARAEVVRHEGGLRLKLLAFITDPNVAYMLMLLGFYGLFFELSNPGAILPGVVGGISLILAFYAFQTLPVNYAGFMLILLAVGLFILEVKVISHGLLAIGGVVAMTIGSLMLFETPGSVIRLSLWVVLPSVAATALFFIVVVRLVIRAARRQPTTGAEGLIGVEGVAHTDINKDEGMVSLHGELWSAYADERILLGERVVVGSVTGLRLKVRRLTEGNT
ncbi:MAG: serine protease [Thermodesulfovibrio sp.]|nr:serine protease [Thermodesulfovibrio sp.]